MISSSFGTFVASASSIPKLLFLFYKLSIKLLFYDIRCSWLPNRQVVKEKTRKAIAAVSDVIMMYSINWTYYPLQVSPF